jgi:hypothetical protein
LLSIFAKYPPGSRTAPDRGEKPGCSGIFVALPPVVIAAVPLIAGPSARSGPS